MSQFIPLTLKHNGRVTYMRKNSIKRVTPIVDGSGGCQILQEVAPSPVEVSEDEEAILHELEQPDGP
jgi:hypothetical protein